MLSTKSKYPSLSQNGGGLYETLQLELYVLTGVAALDWCCNFKKLPLKSDNSNRRGECNMPPHRGCPGQADQDRPLNTNQPKLNLYI